MVSPTNKPRERSSIENELQAHSGYYEAHKDPLQKPTDIINKLPAEKDDNLLYHVLQFVGVGEEPDYSNRQVTKEEMVRRWLTFRAGEVPAEHVVADEVASDTYKQWYSYPAELFHKTKQDLDSQAQILTGIFRVARVSKRFAAIAKFEKDKIDKKQFTLSWQDIRWSIECGVNLRLVEFNLGVLGNIPHTGQGERPLLHVAVQPFFATKPSKKLISSILLLDKNLRRGQKKQIERDRLSSLTFHVTLPLSAHCSSRHYDITIAEMLLHAKPDEGPRSLLHLLSNPVVQPQDKLDYIALVKRNNPVDLLTYTFPTYGNFQPNLLMQLITRTDCEWVLNLLSADVENDQWLKFINYRDRNGATAAHYLCESGRFMQFSRNLNHLLNKGASLTIRMKRPLSIDELPSGPTPFMLLLASEGVDLATKIAVTRGLKARNIDIDAIDGNGPSTLQKVCRATPNFFEWLPVYLERKTPEQIQAILNYRCPEISDREVDNPDFLLNLLCPTISEENLRFLLDQGADPNLKWEERKSAVFAYSQNPDATTDGFMLLFERLKEGEQKRRDSRVFFNFLFNNRFISEGQFQQYFDDPKIGLEAQHSEVYSHLDYIIEWGRSDFQFAIGAELTEQQQLKINKLGMLINYYRSKGWFGERKVENYFNHILTLHQANVPLNYLAIFLMQQGFTLTVKQLAIIIEKKIKIPAEIQIDWNRQDREGNTALHYHFDLDVFFDDQNQYRLNYSLRNGKSHTAFEAAVLADKYAFYTFNHSFNFLSVGNDLDLSNRRQQNINKYNLAKGVYYFFKYNKELYHHDNFLLSCLNERFPTSRLGNQRAKTILFTTPLLDARDELGRTPLHYAALDKDWRVFKILIAEGRVKQDIQDTTGKTAAACFEFERESIESLKDKIGELESIEQESYDGSTATSHNHLRMLFLQKLGDCADPEAVLATCPQSSNLLKLGRAFIACKKWIDGQGNGHSFIESLDSLAESIPQDKLSAVANRFPKLLTDPSLKAFARIASCDRYNALLTLREVLRGAIEDRRRFALEDHFSTLLQVLSRKQMFRAFPDLSEEYQQAYLLLYTTFYVEAKCKNLTARMVPADQAKVKNSLAQTRRGLQYRLARVWMTGTLAVAMLVGLGILFCKQPAWFLDRRNWHHLALPLLLLGTSRVTVLSAGMAGTLFGLGTMTQATAKNSLEEASRGALMFAVGCLCIQYYQAPARVTKFDLIDTVTSPMTRLLSRLWTIKEET